MAETGRWSLFTDVRHMYLGTAEFRDNELFADNRLPYAPRNTFSFLVGGRHRQGLGFQLDMSYIADQFGDNNETIAASADGTVGQLPAYTIFNMMVDYPDPTGALGSDAVLHGEEPVRRFVHLLAGAARDPAGHVSPGQRRAAFELLARVDGRLRIGLQLRAWLDTRARRRSADSISRS